MSPKDFGIRLKKARQEYGLSQRSLGLALGLSDKTISSYESSRSYPNLEILKKLSEVLGRSTDYFLEYDKKEVSLLERIERLEKEVSILKKKRVSKEE